MSAWVTNLNSHSCLIAQGGALTTVLSHIVAFMTTQTLSRSQARRIALAAQGFGQKRSNTPSNWSGMRRVIGQLGLLQIDSVNVCVRSHYMPLFSRLGSYNIAKLDEKLLTPKPKDRGYFEYWGHEASFLPIDMQPLFRWRMAAAEEGQGMWKGISEFGQNNPDVLNRVRNTIRDRGALATRELSIEGEKSGGLWEWKGSKIALEYLFWTGQLTATGRRGFERIYDIPERVIPSDILNSKTPPIEDAQRELTAIAAKALGVATASDLRDYFRLPAKGFDEHVAALCECGNLEPVTVKGWKQQAYLARDAKLPRWVRGAALLTPFDPIVWHRPRAERLFDFDYKIEIYTPAEKRKFGYYCLPFLLDGALVARIDLKGDRQTSTLLVQSAHAETNCCTSDVADALRHELRRLADWLGLEAISVKPKGDLALRLPKLF